MEFKKCGVDLSFRTDFDKKHFKTLVCATILIRVLFNSGQTELTCCFSPCWLITWAFHPSIFYCFTWALLKFRNNPCAGCPVMEGLVVPIPAPTVQCPWARYWTLNCFPKCSMAAADFVVCYVTYVDNKAFLLL